MPGVCSFPKKLEVVAEHHGAPQADHRPCNQKRRLFRLLPPIYGLFSPQTHLACQCNEFVSAHNRVLGVAPLPTTRGLAQVREQLRILSSRLPYPRAESIDEALMHFKGARYTLYSQARESLRKKPLSRSDSYLSCFIKAEKFDPDAKINPDPRMIQARGPRFNLHMAGYIHPLERLVYNIRDEYGLRVFAKGLNSFQKATLIKEKFSKLEDPVCFSLDATRFDKHVSPGLLAEEHRFYRRMFPGDDQLIMLTSWQMRNKCFTSNGVRYSAKGGRMSGDMNTALGNCVLMYSMLMAVAGRLGVKPLVVDDGDDCLMLVEKRQAASFELYISEYFLEFGMSIKLENRADVPEQVVFCQSKIVGDRMVRNPLKVMSNGTSGSKHWFDRNLVRPMLTAVGACELSCNAGVPVLQEYALALLRNGRGQRMSRTDIDSGVLLRAIWEVGSEEKIYQSTEKPVTVDARLQFARVWGIPVPAQLILEQILREWTVEEVVAEPVDVELSADWVVREDPSRVPPRHTAFWTGV